MGKRTKYNNKTQKNKKRTTRINNKSFKKTHSNQIKTKGGRKTKKQIRLLFENMHTSPNIKSTIRVYSKPEIPNSIIDFDALSHLIKYYTENIDEQIEVLKKGDVKPPKKERIINVYINEEDIPIFNDSDREIKQCNQTSDSKK